MKCHAHDEDILLCPPIKYQSLISFSSSMGSMKKVGAHLPLPADTGDLEPPLYHMLRFCSVSRCQWRTEPPAVASPCPLPASTQWLGRPWHVLVLPLVSKVLYCHAVCVLVMHCKLLCPFPNLLVAISPFLLEYSLNVSNTTSILLLCLPAWVHRHNREGKGWLVSFSLLSY